MMISNSIFCVVNVKAQNFEDKVRTAVDELSRVKAAVTSATGKYSQGQWERG